ncbi:Tetratricopeptide repeat (TPR)-like superfamily protein [Raphanus sativus]|nr:Tetratricopeptide repeat (TPR)-like superfamily protein [Raphanus sativus]
MDISVWFFKELKDVYGFRHSRLSSLLVSHILAGQIRFKEIQVVLQQYLQDEGKLFNFHLKLRALSYIGSGSTFLLCELLSNSFSNSILYNFRETDKMWDVYKDIESKNEHTYSTVVDGLCRQQKLEDAVSFLRDSEWKDVGGPSVVSFNSIMSAQSGFVDTAKTFLCTVLKCGLVLTVYSHNILINRFYLAGSIGEVLELAGDLNIKHGVEPDTVTYNILAKGFHLLGMIKWVWEIIQQMLDKGLTPDVITCTILLCGHCQLGNIDKGLRLLKDMRSSGSDLKLNSVIIPCSVMLSGLCKTGRIEEASPCSTE